MQRRLTSLGDTPKFCQSSKVSLVDLRCIAPARVLVVGSQKHCQFSISIANELQVVLSRLQMILIVCRGSRAAACTCCVATACLQEEEEAAADEAAASGGGRNGESTHLCGR